MRLLVLSSAVSAFGEGPAGGVSRLVDACVRALALLGHDVEMLAPEGSAYQGPARLVGLPGALQPTLATGQFRQMYPIPADSLIARYGDYAFAHRHRYDAIINFCHDWLPYYLTPYFDTPLLHVPNLGDENAAVTAQIRSIAARFPRRVAPLSRAQARVLGLGDDMALCPPAIDVGAYSFSASPKRRRLVWCGRIVPEKGLQDAAAAARKLGWTLAVCGYIEDAAYWASVRGEYGDALEYPGFLDHRALTQEIGRAGAMLCTPQWHETLAIVVLESLACGTPVVTYDSGGNGEAIEEAKTGYIVPKGDIAALADAAQRAALLDRAACRASCEARFSLAAYAARLQEWLSLALRP